MKTKALTQQYCLTISEEQADIISRALDLYERVGGLGQIEVVAEPWIFRRDANALELARRALDQAKLYLTGFEYGASYGIYSEGVPDEYRVAYDLQQVIRYRLAWDKTPEGGIGVWFDKPHRTGKVSLAKIEHVPVRDVVEMGDREATEKTTKSKSTLIRNRRMRRPLY